VYHLFLLVAVTLGLFGQGLAFAAAPLQVASGTMASASAASTSLQTECAEMSSMEDDDTTPCNGLTADCIEKMGCIAPFTLKEPGLAQTSSGILSGMKPTWPLVSNLAGLSVPPELDPPTHLS
jgi:hypothetical protein